MRPIAGLAFALMCLLAGPIAVSADQGAYPTTEAAKDAAYSSLHWQSEMGAYKLPASHATIKLKGGYLLMLGHDAARYSWLASGVEFPDTEAVITYESGNATAMVYYEWHDEGYISDSDWGDVEPDALLAKYREGTESSNDTRVANGMNPMEVVGWLEAPHYDKASRTVTYAIELKDKDGAWVNAFALRLGRGGYTEFTWVGPVGAFKSASSRPALLNHALSMHSFDKGYRYTDYTDGDKVASYGIAGLIAAAMGAKFGKGLFAGLLVAILGFKKVLVPAIAVGAAAIMKFGRRLMGGGQHADT